MSISDSSLDCRAKKLEVVKVRMQTSQMTLKEVVSEFKSFGDLYLGAGACITRDVTFSAVLFLRFNVEFFLSPILMNMYRKSIRSFRLNETSSLSENVLNLTNKVRLRPNKFEESSEFQGMGGTQFKMAVSGRSTVSWTSFNLLENIGASARFPMPVKSHWISTSLTCGLKIYTSIHYLEENKHVIM